MKKLISIILVAALCLTCLTGCKFNPVEKIKSLISKVTEKETEEVTEEDTTETASVTEASTEQDTEVLTPDERERAELVIGTGESFTCLSPFFGSTGLDTDIMSLINLRLFDTDREGVYVTNGIEGETRSFNGKDYTYSGIASTVGVKNDDGSGYYDLTIRDDIYFSDGEKMTIDDVIFSIYVYCDPSYDGYYGFSAGAISGLYEYLTDDEVTVIKGIEKLDDYKLRIHSDKFYSNCPLLYMNVGALHYYGNKSEYDYDEGKFGFKKGDLSPVHAKDDMPLGTGPYVLEDMKKTDDGQWTIMLTANKNFYLGEPKIKTVDLKACLDSKMIPSIMDGSIDVMMSNYSLDQINEMSKVNSNGEVTGDKITAFPMDNLGYGYIGISANVIKVGDDPGSDESKSLRRALMTVFSIYREDSIAAFYGETAHVIEYPESDVSWAAPKKDEAGYRIAFSKDKDGKTIYNSDTPQEEKVLAAKTAALGFFEKAGYTVTDGKVVAAPEGGLTEFDIYIIGEGTGSHGTYKTLKDSEKTLAEMGITLNIHDVVADASFWNGIDDESISMWVAAFNTSTDPDVYQNYYSGSNPEYPPGSAVRYFDIADEELDALIIKTFYTGDQGQKRALFKQCYDKIEEWGVILPTYQRMNVTVASTERVNINSLAPDLTGFYKWTRELYKVETK